MVVDCLLDVLSSCCQAASSRVGVTVGSKAKEGDAVVSYDPSPSVSLEGSLFVNGGRSI
jgi:hypothetical protein